MTIKDGELVARIQGIRKLGTLKSELSIPLTQVRGARAHRGQALARTQDLGNGRLRRYLGGTFSQDGDRVFWDVADPAKAIVISLEDDDLKRLYVEVEEPEKTVQMIEAAIAKSAYRPLTRRLRNVEAIPPDASSSWIDSCGNSTTSSQTGMTPPVPAGHQSHTLHAGC
ncbi:hypothetical protein HCJ93_16785 [Streptomyces sp. SBST2-5]|uniref:Uncharacterized protein n=1 Tax=Streptomyces composti TaxID=2720025 RepID=A0ABX1ADG6_9ACTN|nr:hypothetical protein [Streptomyces composti]NJP51676.1 hypothetical protein [Streptomyces composti]